MKLRWRLLAVLALAFVLIAGSLYSQRIFEMKAADAKIEVLSPKVFEASPALAPKVSPHQAFKQTVPNTPGEIAEDCGHNHQGMPLTEEASPAPAPKVSRPQPIKQAVPNPPREIAEDFDAEYLGMLSTEKASPALASEVYPHQEFKQTGPDYGQQIFYMEAAGAKIEILSPEVFEARFGKNQHIPRTEEAILALALKVYPPQALMQTVPNPPGEKVEDCGTEDLGLLFAALQNPAVSNATRMLVADITEEAIPNLPQSKISDSGHFIIRYTKRDKNFLNDVTDGDINILAQILDSLWDKYATNFQEPKADLIDGVKMIEVKVYYISNTIRGSTGSGINVISLNSVLCVSNDCKRQTTAAHELFHRVQYAYGYESGTPNMKWMTEGTAAWSQKYTYPGIRDYMERMQEGLLSNNLNLLTERSYDACHFWVFLQEQARLVQGDQASWKAIKEAWANYSVYKSDKEAVYSVTNARLGLDFDEFATKWSKANYIKDLTNNNVDWYYYEENTLFATSCRVKYGPLSQVPKSTLPYPTTIKEYSGSVEPYGAQYTEFTVGDTADLAITFTGTGSFSVAFIGIKNDSFLEIADTTDASYEYRKTLENPGAWDKVAVVVMGTTTGGNYTLTVGRPICQNVGGEWQESYWGFSLSGGSTITGSYFDIYGKNLPVTGTYTPPNITITLPYGNPIGSKWTIFKGTVDGDCNSIYGTYTTEGGYTDSFVLTK
jgi:hypothetical protein